MPQISTLDAILGDSAVLGCDATPYRNNALRVANLYFIQSPSSARRGFEKIAIAVAFHDLGCWTDHFIDCLAPSGLSSDWLASSDEPRWTSWLRYAPTLNPEGSYRACMLIPVLCPRTHAPTSTSSARTGTR